MHICTVMPMSTEFWHEDELWYSFFYCETELWYSCLVWLLACFSFIWQPSIGYQYVTRLLTVIAKAYKIYMYMTVLLKRFNNRELRSNHFSFFHGLFLHRNNIARGTKLSLITLWLVHLYAYDFCGILAWYQIWYVEFIPYTDLLFPGKKFLPA
jgi:hypothetical protein